MSDSSVLSSMHTLHKSDRTGVLATIVNVEGSAYRRPGAKMLIPRDGEGVGSITAGCLRDEVHNLAADVLADGSPRLETFDLTGEDDIWGLGVGCNGVITILLEPVSETYAPILKAYEDGSHIAFLTVLNGGNTDLEDWQRAYYRLESGSSVLEGSVPTWFIDAVEEPTSRLVESSEADTVELEGPEGVVEVFIDGISTPPTLLVVGTGHDVQPVVELATKTNFRTVVVGFRGANATEDRFPRADAVTSTSPTDICDAVEIDENTYCVVMTHNFIDDRLVLDELVETSAPYIGLMGPRERFNQMLEEYEDEPRFKEDTFDAIFTPIGLDLGGGSPYQIALSIVGEVLAVHNGRDPQHLKDREGAIHDRIDVEKLT